MTAAGSARRALPEGVGHAPFSALLWWLALTLLGWLAFYRRSDDPNLAVVLLIAVAGIGAVALGSRLGVGNIGPQVLDLHLTRVNRGMRPLYIFLAMAGSLYFLVVGLANVRLAQTSGFDVATLVQNPNLGYDARAASLNSAAVDGNVWSPVAGIPLESLVNAFKVLYFVTPPLLSLRWSQFSPLVRYVTLGSLIFSTATWALIGTGKGFFDMMVVGGSALVLRRVTRRGFRSEEGSVRKPNGPRRLALALVGAVAFLAGSFLLGSRVIASNLGIDGQGTEAGGFLVTLLGRTVATGANVLTGYVTHGYTGLSLSLTQPFEWTRGSGAFGGLESIFPALYNANLAVEAYPFRAEYATGWSATGKWATLYPWIGSDFTMYGAVIFVGALAAIAGAAWTIASIRGGLWAAAIFCQGMYTLAYIPLNNGPLRGTAELVSAMILLSGATWMGVVAALREPESLTGSTTTRGVPSEPARASYARDDGI